MRYALSEAREWVRAHVKDYMTVLYTPFLPDGEIDEDGLRHNVRHTLSRPGVGGLSVNSIHQEFWTLTAAERKRLVEIVLDEVGGRAPVVVGVSDPAARNVVDYAAHAKAAGADLVMAWPPYYGARTPAGVRDFYDYVGARIEIGIVVYSTTLAELGFYLTPDMVEGLLGIRHVCAVQDSTMNFSSYAAMVERVGDRIAVTTSLEEYFLFGKLAFGEERAADFLLGCSRPLFAQTAEKPHCGDFIAAVRRRDYEAAARHVRTIVAIAQQLQSRYFARGFHHVALFKQLAALLGMADATVRPPLSAPEPRELEECVAVMRAAGLLAEERVE